MIITCGRSFIDTTVSHKFQKMLYKVQQQNEHIICVCRAQLQRSSPIIVAVHCVRYLYPSSIQLKSSGFNTEFKEIYIDIHT